MWQCLRDRRLGGFKFYRQYVLKNYIVDFFNCDALLIVEIDGESHADPNQRLADVDRDHELALYGFRTIRIKAAEVEIDTAHVCSAILDVVYEEVSHQLSSRPPSHPERG